MFSKVSVLIPTRHRLGRLQMLLKSYYTTTKGMDQHSELVFRVDEDDQQTISFLHLTRHEMVIGPRLDGYRSMPTFFNELAQAATGDVLMCGNDDMVFQSEEWALEILKVANQFPDGVFNLGVSTFNELHYPFSTISRRVVEKLGFIWDPRIFWGDIYLRDVMGTLGRTKLVPHVQIDHDWMGFHPDKVFMETRPAKEVVEGSSTYWQVIHAPAVAEAVGKLRELL